MYYGVQSLRAAENFHITGLNMHPEIINSLAYIKKAAAITNCEVGILDKTIADAIVKACDEILKGKLHDNFIVDPIQGGAGTSLNMNANEVIANRRFVEETDLIPKEEVVITMTKLGYIKRMSNDTFKAQNRGGKGIKGMQTLEEDYVEELFMTHSHHYICLLYTSRCV